MSETKHEGLKPEHENHDLTRPATTTADRHHHASANGAPERDPIELCQTEKVRIDVVGRLRGLGATKSRCEGECSLVLQSSDCHVQVEPVVLGHRLNGVPSVHEFLEDERRDSADT